MQSGQVGKKSLCWAFEYNFFKNYRQLWNIRGIYETNWIFTATILLDFFQLSRVLFFFIFFQSKTLIEALHILLWVWCFIKMAKKFVMPDFQEIAQFVRSQQAQQHIENSERHISRKEKLSPFEKKAKI